MKKLRQFLKREIETIIKPKRKKKYNKVFCVGWVKTGTTSCGHALKRLGFKHKTWDPVVRDWYRRNNIEKVIKHARYFESFDDMPWNHYEIIPILDLTFPNSRFILLERDEESWKDSLIRFKNKRGLKFKIDEEIKYFRKHNEFIRNYFLGPGEGNKDHLLIMNIIEGDSYDKFCNFLEMPVPKNVEFPHIAP